MKKWIVLLMCIMALCLTACGDNADADAQPSETETVTVDKKAIAESCIDKSVQDLFALIGEPESSEYVPSCLGSGEDGNLYYADFTVYTYREGDTETVRVVE